VIARAKKQESWLTLDQLDSPGPSTYNNSAGMVPKKVNIGSKYKEIPSFTPGPGSFELSPQNKFASSQTFGLAKRDDLLVEKEK